MATVLTHLKLPSKQAGCPSKWHLFDLAQPSMVLCVFYHPAPLLIPSICTARHQLVPSVAFLYLFKALLQYDLQLRLICICNSLIEHQLDT